MCGIAGFYSAGCNSKNIITAMTDVLIHRGPDDSGIWCDSNSKISFGHRRLAVQDLSEAGRQPMISENKRFAFVFNGEIYNHLDLRAQLELVGKNMWRGHSDTETLLAGFEYWGIEATIKKTKGMFAFAVYDSHENTLTLGRDRLGEKPLYYGWQGNSFIFSSELKPFKAHPDFLNRVDRQALTQYLRYNCVPGVACIYKGISKLAPGSILTFSLSDKKYSITTYWSLLDVIRSAKAQPYEGDENDAVDELELRLKESIRDQMLSDVPLGAFLSGGIDSSIIVALMQAQSGKPIKTFSIGFDKDGFNEAEHAKAVAEHLGTHHTELYVTADMALGVIPKLPHLYDEPFADSSQIPTYLVAEMAREYVTVALSGDAGDELFCGYNRYLATERIWSKLKFMPLSLRRLLAFSLTLLPEAIWDNIFSKLPIGDGWAHVGQKLYKAAIALRAKNLDGLYRSLVSHWQNPEVVSY